MEEQHHRACSWECQGFNRLRLIKIRLVIRPKGPGGQGRNWRKIIQSAVPPFLLLMSVGVEHFGKEMKMPRVWIHHDQTSCLGANSTQLPWNFLCIASRPMWWLSIAIATMEDGMTIPTCLHAKSYLSRVIHTYIRFHAPKYRPPIHWLCVSQENQEYQDKRWYSLLLWRLGRVAYLDKVVLIWFARAHLSISLVYVERGRRIQFLPWWSRIHEVREISRNSLWMLFLRIKSSSNNTKAIQEVWDNFHTSFRI